MAVENRVRDLENEVKILKNEIKTILEEMDLALGMKINNFPIPTKKDADVEEDVNEDSEQ